MAKETIAEFRKAKEEEATKIKKQTLLEERARSSVNVRFLELCNYLKKYGQLDDFKYTVEQNSNGTWDVIDQASRKKNIQVYVEGITLLANFNGSRGSHLEKYQAKEIPTNEQDGSVFAWVSKENEQFNDSELAEHLIVSLAKAL